jgi:hypothetical protein
MTSTESEGMGDRSDKGVEKNYFFVSDNVGKRACMFECLYLNKFVW